LLAISLMLALISSIAAAMVFIFVDISSAAPATSLAFTPASSAPLAIAFMFTDILPTLSDTAVVWLLVFSEREDN